MSSTPCLVDPREKMGGKGCQCLSGRNIHGLQQSPTKPKSLMVSSLTFRVWKWGIPAYPLQNYNLSGKMMINRGIWGSPPQLSSKPVSSLWDLSGLFQFSSLRFSLSLQLFGFRRAWLFACVFCSDPNVEFPNKTTSGKASKHFHWLWREPCRFGR